MLHDVSGLFESINHHYHHLPQPHLLPLFHDRHHKKPDLFPLLFPPLGHRHRLPSVSSLRSQALWVESCKTPSHFTGSACLLAKGRRRGGACEREASTSGGAPGVGWGVGVGGDLTLITGSVLPRPLNPSLQALAPERDSMLSPARQGRGVLSPPCQA